MTNCENCYHTASCEYYCMQNRTWDCDNYKDKTYIIELPVRIGDVIYTNVSWSGWYLREKDKPYKAKVVFIGVNGEKNFMNVVYEKNDNMLTFNFDEIGKRVFLTREEAKKAIANNSK